MKIGFLINDLTQGGAQRAAVSLANYFQQQGYQAEIITFEQTDSFYQIDESVSVVSVGFKEIEQSFSLKRLNSTIKRMVSLRKFIKSRNLDILIGMSFSMTYYSVFSTKFTSTKSVGTERSNPFVYKATRLNTILRRIFYRLADGYVLQTKKSAEFFDGGKLKNGIVIPNAIYNTKIYTLPRWKTVTRLFFQQAGSVKKNAMIY
jgi:UDP-N-acetylglucosamine:LPS N-acetylglucosamine transferase